MGQTQPGGYYLNAAGDAVDAEGKPAKKDAKALADAATVNKANKQPPTVSAGPVVMVPITVKAKKR